MSKALNAQREKMMEDLGKLTRGSAKYTAQLDLINSIDDRLSGSNSGWMDARKSTAHDTTDDERDLLEWAIASGIE